METIAFFVLLSLGLFGWYGMMHWDRHNAWWMRAAAVLCFFGLTGAGRWLPDLTRIERERTATSRVESSRVELAGVESSSVPSPDVMVTFDPRWGAKRESEYLNRWREVYAAIGPPPAPDAVPKRGYMRGGKPVSPSWVTRPDGEEENNLVY